MAIKWSEKLIAGALVRGIFERQVLAVPRCNWTGNECDLLIVTKDLRIIDVEIKIDRSDVKADLKKDKWWRGPWKARVRREWPEKVWKHYYAIPKDIWKPGLEEFLPKCSGILLLTATDARSITYGVGVTVHRRATVQRGAAKVSTEAVFDIARLAGLRMWDALHQLNQPAAQQILEE